MKKPIAPVKPPIPPILNNIWWKEPSEFVEVTLYKTQTILEIELANKGLTTKSPLKDIQRAMTDATIDESEDGDLVVYGQDEEGNDYENHETEEVDLDKLIETLSPEDIKRIKVRPISNYRGDYIYGPPGVHIFVEKDNPLYEEAMKAYNEYKVVEKQYRKEWCDYDIKLMEYNKYKQDKIKEIEDAEEI